MKRIYAVSHTPADQTPTFTYFSHFLGADPTVGLEQDRQLSPGHSTDMRAPQSSLTWPPQSLPAQAGKASSYHLPCPHLRSCGEAAAFSTLFSVPDAQPAFPLHFNTH